MKTSPAARLAAGLGFLTLLRLLLIGKTDLIPDEAYYYSWAKHLAACYWDQPGGIAFVNALGAHLFGRSVFAVRLPAVILSLLSSLFAFDLGRTCLRSSSRAANGVLLTQLLPLLSLGAVLMLHDSLLGAAATAALACMARAVLLDKPRWWFAAGMAGTAALYAKFSAVLLAPGFLLFVALSPKGRAALKRPELYLSLLLAAVLFWPVIAWNRGHEWVAFYAVKKLSIDMSLNFPHRLLSVLDYFGSQVAITTPILFGFMAWACARTFARRARPDIDGRLFLASMAAGIFFYFAAQALRAKVQGNWAALAYLPAGLLAADLMAEEWRRARVRRWAIGGILLAGAVTLAIHAHTLVPFLPIPAKSDPTAQAHGWKELAARVRGELDKLPPGSPVMVRRYQTGSELEYYLGPGVEVVCASYDSRGSQYELEQDYARIAGRDLVYVDPKGYARKLFLHFSKWEQLPSVDLGAPGRSFIKMDVFILRGFHVDGPYEDYFSRPFAASLEQLKKRIRVGSLG